MTQISAKRAWITTTLFFVCMAFSYVDRQIISILVQPIKTTVGLNDTEIGLLQGLSFTLFYLIAGIPLSWLADRVNRVRLAAGCIFVWSLATTCTGLSRVFPMLVIARAGTAAAEAGFHPAALSVVGDIFPARHIPRATALFMLGPIIGSGCALLLGGALLSWFSALAIGPLPIIGRLHAWQWVFVAVGVPGMLLAGLVLAMVKEPSRRELRATLDGNSTEPVSFSAACLFLLTRDRFYPLYFLGFAFFILATTAYAAWFPSVVIRKFLIDPKTAGLVLGSTFLISGVLGNVFAQFYASRHVERTGALPVVMRVIVGSIAMMVPLAIVAPLLGNYVLAVVLYAPLVLLLSTTQALFLVPLLLSVPNRMRGQSIGIFALVINAFGGTVGPLMTGVFSDGLGMGGAGTAIALAITSGAGILGALGLLYAASQSTLIIGSDLADAAPALDIHPSLGDPKPG